MRILILSDLHLELWREYAPRIDTSKSNPDVVVLAGDISTGANAVPWANHTFAGIPVLYVTGNHEAYGGELENVYNAIHEACTQTENVRFLNCDEFILNDVRFLGCTLWTDFDLFGTERRQDAMREAEAAMNDYHRIRLVKARFRKLRPSDTLSLHCIQKKWLQEKLAEPFAGKTVVITHMAPSMKSVSERYVNDIVTACFASNLDDLVALADIWVHGHMHEPVNYEIAGCLVTSNPCGYKNKSGGPENMKFDPNLVLEI